MKTTFDKTTRDELIARIESLNENSTAVWGKMNVYQMLKHCTIWEDMILGKPKYKQVFLGRIFGKMALKSTLKNEAPIGHNLPTLPSLKITDSGDMAAQKAAWIVKLQAHEHFPDSDLMHPFFGKMTKEQIGLLAYKHTDHHLRQFNA